MIKQNGVFLKPVKFMKKKIAYHVGKWRAFVAMASHFVPRVRKQSDRLLLSLALGLGYVFMGLIEPWPMKMIFDNVFWNHQIPQLLAPVLGPYQDDKYFLLYILISFIIVISIFRGVLYYNQQLLTSRSGQQIVTGIRLDLYSHLQNLSFSFHDRRRTGDMIARLTTDIKILRDILVTLPLTITSEILLMLSMIAVMAYMDIQLTALALMVVPVLLLLVKKYRSPMKHAMRRQREREGHLSSIASEVLGAIKVVQGFHQEPYEVKKFNVENHNSLKSGLKATRIEAKLKWASELSVAIVTAVVLGVAGQRVLTGVLSPGDLLVFAFYLKMFNRPLRRISKITEQLARGTASGERILDLLQIEPEIRNTNDAKEAPRLTGEIKFENVCFEYKPGKPTLKGINLHILAGERVAVVGHTGSGKSTLVSLISRFYNYNSGKILMDGVDIKEWTIHSLRKQISIVFQEPVLFATSIAENIAYGRPDATIDEIKEAAKKARIDGIIESLPEGYETIIGERGGTLSGGQRQCVAIARSMIKNAPIVILDEPTSGLDLPSALMVMEAIRELVKNKTVVVISHQRETLYDVDRVVQMSKGRLVADKSSDDFWQKESQKRQKKQVVHQV